MTATPLFVGIDLARADIVVACHPAPDSWTTTCDPEGIAATVDRMLALAPALIVLEPSGGQETALVGALAAAALPVVVVDRRAVNELANTAAMPTATGGGDAQLLARVAERVPRPGALTDAARGQLQALVTRRTQLLQMVAAERQRLIGATASIRLEIREHLRWLESRIPAVDRELDDSIRKSPVWRADEDGFRAGRAPAWLGDAISRLPRALLPAVIVAILVARLLWVVTANVVNMPYGDEWYVWSDLLDALDAQGLSWSVLVTPYNGHRLVVARLALLALLPTRWHVAPQVCLTVLLAAALFGACWYQYRRSARELRVDASPWAAVGMAAFVFSAADINLLWGLGLVWYGVVLGSALCLMLLAARPFRWWRLVLAALCAAAASFSVGAGMLAWIIGIPTIWIATAHSRARTSATLCWSAAAVAFCALYLRNLAAGPGLMPNWGYVLGHPVQLVGFVMTFLGVAIEPRYDATLIFWPGAVAIVLWMAGGIATWRSRHDDLIPLLPWLAVSALAVAGGAMIASARLGTFSVTQHYVTLARLFWICSAALLWLVVSRSQSTPGTKRAWLVAGVLVVLGVELRQHDFAGRLWQAPRAAMIQMSYDAPDVCAGNWDAASRITSPAGAVRARYPTLARHRLSFIQRTRLDRLSVVESPAGTAGEMQQAIVEFRPPDKGPPCVRLSGWAIDPNTNEPASEVLLVREDSVVKRGMVSRETADVAARLGNPALGRSGWALVVSATRWPADPSRFKLYAVSRDGRTAYRLDTSHAPPLPSGHVARYHDYELGTVITLTTREPAGVDQLGGFSEPEPEGRWTDGKEATIGLALSAPATSALTFTATVAAFVTAQHPRQGVDIMVNGTRVGRWEFQHGEPLQARRVVIPQAVAQGATHLLITFSLPDAAVPAALGFNSDTRMLGLNVRDAHLSAATN